MAKRERGQLVKRCCSEGTCRCTPKRYLIRVYLGRIDGKRKYVSRTFEGTKKDADAELTKWLRDLDQHTFTRDRDHIRMSELLDEMLEQKRGSIASTTLETYSWGAEVIRESLGHYQLRQLSPALLQEFFNELGEKYGPSSVQSLRSHMSQALKLARIRGYLSKDLLESVETVRKRTHTAGSVWSSEQINEFLSYTEGQTRWHALFVLLLNTGLRPQEALPLQWADIEGDTLHIRRTVRASHSRRKQYLVEEGKTAASLGRIRLPTVALEALKEHRKAQIREQLESPMGWNSENWVFPTRDGLMPVRNTIAQAWKRWVKKSGLPRIRLYDTRHTHATELLEAKVSIRVVQERLRHSDVATTLRVYSHVTDRMEQEAVDTIDRIREAVSH